MRRVVEVLRLIINFSILDFAFGAVVFFITRH